MTKNPAVLQSVNFIHSWFKNKIKTPEEVAMFNLLDVVDSDKFTLTTSMPKRERLNRYNNVDERLKMSRGESVDE